MVEDQEQKNGERLDVNITVLWHKSLFDNLQEIQMLIGRCLNGCNNIIEHLQLDPAQVPDLQFQTLKILVNTFSITLVNAKEKLTKEYFEKAKKTLNSIKKILNINKEMVLKTNKDSVRHCSGQTIQPMYYKILGNISNLREELVEQLVPILYGEEKETTLDKSKKEFKYKKWQNLKI